MHRQIKRPIDPLLEQQRRYLFMLHAIVERDNHNIIGLEYRLNVRRRMHRQAFKLDNISRIAIDKAFDVIALFRQSLDRITTHTTATVEKYSAVFIQIKFFVGQN